MVSVRGSKETISVLVKKCLDVFFFLFSFATRLYTYSMTGELHVPCIKYRFYMYVFNSFL